MNEWTYEIRVVVMPPEYRVSGVPLNWIVLIVKNERAPRGMNEWNYEVGIVVVPPEYCVPGVPLTRIVLGVENERRSPRHACHAALTR
jgi:hypothetical protein